MSGLDSAASEIIGETGVEPDVESGDANVGVGITVAGSAARASATAASTVAWMSDVGAEVGVDSVVQAANRTTKANNARLFPMPSAYADDAERDKLVKSRERTPNNK